MNEDKKQQLLPMLCEAFVIATMALMVFGGSAGASWVQDQSIESNAIYHISQDANLQNNSIWVESDNGVVTLMGTVHDESEKSLAESCVWRVPGVSRIINRLE